MRLVIHSSIQFRSATIKSGQIENQSVIDFIPRTSGSIYHTLGHLMASHTMAEPGKAF